MGNIALIYVCISRYLMKIRQQPGIHHSYTERNENIKSQAHNHFPMSCSAYLDEHRRLCAQREGILQELGTSAWHRPEEVHLAVVLPRAGAVTHGTVLG